MVQSERGNGPAMAVERCHFVLFAKPSEDHPLIPQKLMNVKRMDQLIQQTETHIECWKQFNHYVNLARTKKFTPDDETNFLELKSVIAQDLEGIFASIETQSPSKEEILGLIGIAPSLRYLSEMGDGELRGIENNWHKIYIAWHSILGQLKIKMRNDEGTALFWKKK
jgi:hypothetical protein